ncbi:TIGR01177 family methyltransferase [Methanocaldococcus fervens]|uniref:tRNA (guanine(10)-N(2))-dimethyltransferase n=1 Tax=Methanocaldococcus fervens (strain DSM 4213 / JCM 15782 / AG86) TaxID=573064 RepID=C7P8K8_METFA|nr:TIGR01177 family methyltransferase [Methanocaldococcus fervens]ACV24890.1 putative RNA methylase [Methanocaldococcus fervens AG86]
MIGYVLNGEHEEIPYAELMALLEIFNYNGSVERLKRYIITEDSPAKKIVKRSGYIDEGHRIVFKYDLEEKNVNLVDKVVDDFIKSFEEFIKDRDYPDIDESKSYAVRVLKLHKDEFTKSINSLKIERELGGIIKLKTNAKVNLTKPDVLVRVVILENNFFVSNVLEMRDREYFQKNRPHLRKYFHPGCMLPKLARTMVNLARVKEGDVVLDPFCGTGGFLIEAGLIGAKLIGCDIDWRMASGTLINLEEYNLLDNVIKVKKLDAKYVKEFLNELNIEKVDAVVTDPPYGISTAKKGEIEKILKMLPEVIKENGYFVFAYPKKVELDMELEGLYKVYIHKGLIRHIHVYKKV